MGSQENISQPHPDEEKGQSRYTVDRFPQLDTEQKRTYAKTFSCIEIATFLLDDIQTKVREEKRALTPPNTEKRRNPILSKEVAESLLKDLNLSGKIKLIFDEEEIKNLATKKPLTDEEEDQRKAVIGYQWQEDIKTDKEKSELEKKLESCITDAEKAKKAMIEHNYGLAISFAIKSAYKKVPEFDRKQASIEGLTKAVIRFDYRKDFEFATYAPWWIKNAIQSESLNIREIKFPENLELALGVATHLANEYETKHESRPTENELIELLIKERPDMGKLHREEAVKIVLSGKHGTVSLDESLADDSDSSLANVIADQTVNVEEAVDSILRQEKVQMVLETAFEELSDLERKIIEMHFLSEKVVQQIAKDLGFSKNYISQIKIRALAKLHENPKLFDLYQDKDLQDGPDKTIKKAKYRPDSSMQIFPKLTSD